MKTHFVLRWTGLTSIGWIAGWLVTSKVLAVSLNDPQFAFLTIFALPALIGFLQWRFALEGTLKGSTWISHTIAIGLLMFVASMVVPVFSLSYIIVNDAVSNRRFNTAFNFNPRTGSLLTITLLGSPLVTVICFAIPLMSAFRSYKRGAILAIIGSVAASVAGEFAFLAWCEIRQRFTIGYGFDAFLSQLCFSVVLGLFVHRILKNAVTDQP